MRRRKKITKCLQFVLEGWVGSTTGLFDVISSKYRVILKNTPSSLPAVDVCLPDDSVV